MRQEGEEDFVDSEVAAFCTVGGTQDNITVGSGKHLFPNDNHEFG